MEICCWDSHNWIIKAFCQFPELILPGAFSFSPESWSPFWLFCPRLELRVELEPQPSFGQCQTSCCRKRICEANLYFVRSIKKSYQSLYWTRAQAHTQISIHLLVLSHTGGKAWTKGASRRCSLVTLLSASSPALRQSWPRGLRLKNSPSKQAAPSGHTGLRGLKRCMASSARTRPPPARHSEEKYEEELKNPTFCAVLVRPLRSTCVL